MKNKQQLTDCLSKVRCPDKSTETAIKKFLKKTTVRVKFSKNPQTPVITYEGFLKWYQTDYPVKGDFIYIPETGLMGIINEVCYDYFVFSVSYQDGKLNPLPVNVPICPYRVLKDDELLKFQQVFSQKGISWNNVKGVVPKLKLQNNVLYRISRLGVNLGVGVFREINEKGDVVFYCVKMDNKPIRFSLYEIIGQERDYQFELMNNKDRDYFASELLAVNRNWNGYLKRIEPLHLRGKRHQKYYYINDIWEIVKVEDKHKPKDLRRFNRGNYFRNLENARLALGILEKTRKDQLINFEGNLLEDIIEDETGVKEGKE